MLTAILRVDERLLLLMIVAEASSRSPGLSGARTVRHVVVSSEANAAECQHRRWAEKGVDDARNLFILRQSFRRNAPHEPLEW